MAQQRVRLAYHAGAWTEGELRVKVRSLSEPDRPVPLATRITATPDVLDFALGKEQEEVTARVSVKAGATLPSDDRVQVKVVADPGTEAAYAALQVAGMMPGVPLPRPFKTMTADVEVLVFPYEVEYTATMPDQSQRVGLEFPVDQDGASEVRVRARVFRVNADGQRQGEVTPVTGQLQGTPSAKGLSLSVSQEGGFGLLVKSTELNVGPAPPPLKAVFKLHVPSGRIFTQHLTFQPRPLQAQLSCDPASVKVTEVHTLEGGNSKLLLKVMTAEGRGVKAAYKLEAPLGSFAPSSGQTDESGEARPLYHPPAPAAAAASQGAWPRTITLKALVGPRLVEAAHCDLTLTFQRRLKIVVEKVGFARLEKELELPGPGSCRLSLVATARDEQVAVAHASVSGSGFPATTTDAEGKCSLELGGSGSHDLGKLTLALEEGMASLQKRVVDGLREGAGSQPPGDYTDAQSKLTELVEKDLVKRLAREEATTFEVTRQVMLALAGSIKVMNMARSCFLRRFGRLETSLRSTLEAILTAIWECWAGDVFTGLLTRLAKGMAGAASAIARALGSLRPVRWAVSGVVKSVNAMRTTFVNFYMRFHNKVSRLFNEANVPSDMRRRLATDPAQGPIPLTPGAIVNQVKESLDDALKVLKGKVDSLRQALQGAQADLATNQAAIREVQELIARQGGTPGMDMGDLPARLAQLQAQAGPIERRLARATGQLQKAELELVDTEARNKTIMVLANELDTLVELGCGLLNVAFNIMVASLLAMIALLLTMVTRGLRRAGARTVVLERLAKLLEDMVGNLLTQEGTERGSKSGQGAVQKLRNQLLATQRNMAGPVLAGTYEVYKDWPEVDTERFRKAVRYYYEEVERNELLTQQSEVWNDFTADMVEWLEWLVLWFSRLGLLLASLVALFGSAGTAAPAVWVFNVEANAAIESFHKWYKGLKAMGSGMSSMAVLAVTVGVVLPAYVEFSVELLGQSDLRDRAAVPLSLPAHLLDPNAFDARTM